MRFWDSSAVVPLVTKEESSARAQRFLKRDPNMVVWALTPVEVRSALQRKRRRGELGADELRESLRRLETLSKVWDEVRDLDRVVSRSFRVLDLHELRAADSLQLAAALVLTGNNPQWVPFVCLDQILLVAAEREGFPTHAF